MEAIGDGDLSRPALVGAKWEPLMLAKDEGDHHLREKQSPYYALVRRAGDARRLADGE